MIKIIFFVFVINFLIIGIYCNSCGQSPKIIFHEDTEERGGRVLIKRQDEMCEWQWSDPHSPEDAKFLQRGSNIKLKALLEEGDGKFIKDGKVSSNSDWILTYALTYNMISDEGRQIICEGKIERRVRILPFLVDPCKKESNPCSKNGIPFPQSSTCEYNPNFKNCKKCECKFGCQAGSGGPESSCIDRNMCNIFYNRCPLNTTCFDLICPETFRCECNKGFELESGGEVNCKSESECRNAVISTKCRNVNECQINQFNCPSGSECVDNWPEVGGCNNDPFYPNSYPNDYFSQRCGYSCRCKEGYKTITLNPLVCEKLCSRKCPPNSRCEFDQNRNERCECQEGFRLNQSETECIPINPCQDRTDDCAIRKPRSLCQYLSPGKYSCVCPKGTPEISGKCVENDQCELGNHNCLRNRKGDPERVDNFVSKGVKEIIQNSYCVSVPIEENKNGFKCECDDKFASVLDENRKQLCVPFPKELDWDLKPLEKRDKSITLPHFALSFSDPSYHLHSEGEKITLNTFTPSEFYRRPLDICGIYQMEYTVDDRARQIYENFVQKYPELRYNPNFQKQIKLKDTRTVTIKPINRCSDNIPTRIDGELIDNIKAKHDCHHDAHCTNTWSLVDRRWETEKTLESCGFKCDCFEGYFEGNYYRYDGDGKQICSLIVEPKIIFKKGDLRRIDDTPHNRDVFDNIDLSKEVNVLIGEKQCFVCKNRMTGNSSLDVNTLTDDEAFYYVPFLQRRLDGKVEIVRSTKEYINHVDKQALEIPLENIDIKILNIIIPPTLIKETGNCNGKPCAQIYVVSYYAEKDGRFAKEKRIVIFPIFDLSDDMEKIRNVLYYLEWVYYLVLIFAVLTLLYVLLISFSRIYACFLYFICGSIDKNNARLAWDTIYFFRHPLNTQARNQLVYQALYID